MKPKLPISFHDLSSLTLDKIQEVIGDLETLGLRRITWAVIPNHNNCGFSPALKFFINKRLENEDEFYLHGYTHQSSLEFKRSFWGKFIQKLTHNEAEFSGLNLTDTRKLLKQSLRTWPEEYGTPSGFVAPTWHGSAYLKSEVLKLGIKVFEDRLYIQNISDLDTRKRYTLPLSFAGIPGGIEIWKHIFPILSRLKIPFRLVLHPHDFADSTKKAHTLRLIKHISEYYDLKPQGDFLS